ncbi:MAG: shikimate kinase [Actinomycetota bacterium]
MRLVAPRRIALIGLPGAGKTVVGRCLAAHLGINFLDLDELIVQNCAMSVAEIFELEGEAGFRKHESRILYTTNATAPSEGLVLACGGGTVLEATNRAVLKAGYEVVYLRVDASVAEARIAETTGRPLLNNNTISQLLVQRSVLYEETASIVLDASGTIDDVVELILSE